MPPTRRTHKPSPLNPNHNSASTPNLDGSPRATLSSALGTYVQRPYAYDGRTVNMPTFLSSNSNRNLNGQPTSANADATVSALRVSVYPYPPPLSNSGLRIGRQKAQAPFLTVDTTPTNASIRADPPPHAPLHGSGIASRGWQPYAYGRVAVDSYGRKTVGVMPRKGPTYALNQNTVIEGGVPQRRTQDPSPKAGGNRVDTSMSLTPYLTLGLQQGKDIEIEDEDVEDIGSCRTTGPDLAIQGAYSHIGESSTSTNPIINLTTETVTATRNPADDNPTTIAPSVLNPQGPLDLVSARLNIIRAAITAYNAETPAYNTMVPRHNALAKLWNRRKANERKKSVEDLKTRRPICTSGPEGGLGWLMRKVMRDGVGPLWENPQRPALESDDLAEDNKKDDGGENASDSNDDIEDSHHDEASAPPSPTTMPLTHGKSLPLATSVPSPLSPGTLETPGAGPRPRGSPLITTEFWDEFWDREEREAAQPGAGWRNLGKRFTELKTEDGRTPSRRISGRIARLRGGSELGGSPRISAPRKSPRKTTLGTNRDGSVGGRRRGRPKRESPLVRSVSVGDTALEGTLAGTSPADSPAIESMQGENDEEEDVNMEE
ncbi:hypothetical protein M501DRAFT_986176 [Patellaria atrata CBS 101060]|uniref:Uncharacterized protein n=1 Tax=Patellaria atrata CBS 101060 TaxID=1346257 RepID=A0A9P4VQN4_9PEZI|nr:hypothetical protein M501DRAFT_986176 [Patellaria atrata CBS 101060]